MRRKNCHYSLANLTGPPHRCPECGREFDPNDAETFDTAMSEEARVGTQIICVLALGFFILVTIAGATIDPVVAVGGTLACIWPAVVLWRFGLRRD